jgi:hypothetical protein
MRYPSTGFLHKSGDLGSGPKNFKNLLLESYILIFISKFFGDLDRTQKNFKLRQKKLLLGCFYIHFNRPIKIL